MELAHIEAFVQVAQHHSFSRAAEALYLSQPSVTARIQALERELGEELFERCGRTVRLTDAGSTFLAYAQRVMKELQEGRDALEALRNAEYGTLRIGSAITISTYVLPKVLKLFRSQYPGVELTVRTGHSDAILQYVLQDEVQVGIERALYHPDVRTVHLYDDAITLVTNKDHRFTRTGRAYLHEIGSEPMIFFDRSSSYYALIHDIFRDAGIVPRHAMELDNIEATKKMVEEGLGIAVLPRVAVERELKLGILTEIDIVDAPPIRREIALIFRRSRRQSRTVAAFVRLLHSLYRFELDDQLAELVGVSPAAAVS